MPVPEKVPVTFLFLSLDVGIAELSLDFAVDDDPQQPVEEDRAEAAAEEGGVKMVFEKEVQEKVKAGQHGEKEGQSGDMLPPLRLAPGTLEDEKGIQLAFFEPEAFAAAADVEQALVFSRELCFFHFDAA